METIPITGYTAFVQLWTCLPPCPRITPILPSQEKDEDDDVDNGLGHMTDKPFSARCKYVNLGFVHDMTNMKSDNHYFVRAHVCPSMKSDLPHNVTIILSTMVGCYVNSSCCYLRGHVMTRSRLELI